MTLYDLTFVDRQKFSSNYQEIFLIQCKEKGSVPKATFHGLNREVNVWN